MKKPPRSGKRATPVAKVRHPTAKDRFQSIKSFVNFKFRDDNYTARKIKRYNDALEEIKRQGATTYKSRSKKNIEIVRKSVGLPGFKQFKAIPVPNQGATDMEIKVINGQVQTETHHLVQTIVEFNPRSLVKDPRGYVSRKLARYSRNDVFKIKAGAWEINRPIFRDLVADEVTHLMEKYAAGNSVTMSRGGIREITKKNDAKHWLNGVVRLSTKNQASKETVMRRVTARDRARKEELRKRRKRKKK